MVHPPHTFCFAELYTPDVSAAKAFYGNLFGWTTGDQSGMYAIFQKDGHAVAAVRRSDRGESLWVCQVAVPSVDSASTRVQALGGRILMPPFDTPGVARTAVVADPEGAVFGLWEDRGKPGAEVQERTGSMWWVELLTADRAAARSFYADLFAWTSGETLKYETPSPYVIFKAGEAAAGGACQTEPEWHMKPGWMVTFATDDYDMVVGRACAMGGQETFNREVPGTGRLAIIMDPSDALFYIMHPKVIVP